MHTRFLQEQNMKIALIFQLHFIVIIFRAAFNKISYKKNVENVLGLRLFSFFSP